MEKDGALKVVSSLALVSLLSATACGASSRTNPNTPANPSGANEQLVTGMYVGVGARCTTYTIDGVATLPARDITDPVMGPTTLYMPDGGQTELYNCTAARLRVPVRACRKTKAEDSLSCEKVGGGTISGSIYTPPPRKPGDAWSGQYGISQTPQLGAGWSARRRG